MSSHADTRVPDSGRPNPPWAVGLAVFAGILMIVAGCWALLIGFSALLSDALYDIDQQYVYAFSATGWAWVHLALGVFIAGAGLGVLWGATWARVVGVTLAALSAMVGFTFIPVQPVSAVASIALDVAIIWALANYRHVD
jgi:hypothetical protein